MPDAILQDPTAKALLQCWLKAKFGQHDSLLVLADWLDDCGASAESSRWRKLASLPSEAHLKIAIAVYTAMGRW